MIDRAIPELSSCPPPPPSQARYRDLARGETEMEINARGDLASWGSPHLRDCRISIPTTFVQPM